MAKLITTEQYEGYQWEDLVAEMTPAQAAQFDQWMHGQTVALHQGKRIVYRWDWERFLAGLPVID